MTDLQDIPITENTALASFDITDMYTNIPTKEIPKMIHEICNNVMTPQQVKRETRKTNPYNS
jgi:hypothetical protein